MPIVSQYPSQGALESLSFIIPIRVHSEYGVLGDTRTSFTRPSPARRTRSKSGALTAAKLPLPHAALIGVSIPPNSRASSRSHFTASGLRDSSADLARISSKVSSFGGATGDVIATAIGGTIDSASPVLA